VLESTTSPAARRQAFRERLSSGTLLQFPGAFNPLSAMLVERLGFAGVYVSGAVIAADLGLPDIGLTTLTEVARRAGEIARVHNLPTLVDADTGFGEPMNAARTIQTLEDAGVAGCHIEDQINPKRCGHLDGKAIVASEEMVRRVKAAVDGRRDENFVICARTDARAIEGLPSMIDRAKAYLDAGADMVFPEALADESEFEIVREALDAPILANMTEFGKSKLLSAETLASLGVNVVIYPVTLLRLAMGAAADGLSAILATGDQSSILDRMQTRAELYDLLDYEAYNAFDTSIFNFTVEGK